MGKVGKITFTPLRDEDLVLLHRWLNEPHMRAHYQKKPITLAEVIAKYSPRIHSDHSVHCHIASLDGEPLGKIQCYRMIDHIDYAAEIDVFDGVSIDLFIGEPTKLRKGLGKSMLRQYVDEVVSRIFPLESKCFIAHEKTNVAASKCSLAAGFIFVGEVVEGGTKLNLFSASR